MAKTLSKEQQVASINEQGHVVQWTPRKKAILELVQSSDFAQQGENSKKSGDSVGVHKWVSSERRPRRTHGHPRGRGSLLLTLVGTYSSFYECGGAKGIEQRSVFAVLLLRRAVRRATSQQSLDSEDSGRLCGAGRQGQRPGRRLMRSGMGQKGTNHDL